MNADQPAAEPNSSSSSTAWKPLALLICPCVISAMFSLKDTASPPLTASAGRPGLVFDTYMLHEGTEPIAPQPLLTPYFTFRNKGKEPVVIQELSPACSSCVTPEVSAKEIPPGGEGKVIFRIATRNQPAGLREYLVTVKYADPRPREVLLTYNVVLPEKQIEIEPRVLMVMGAISNKDRDIVSIADHRPDRTESPMKILGVVSSSSLFTAQSVGHSTVEGVNRNSIEVTYADSIPVGQHRGVITVSTDDTTYPILQIPVILGDRKRPTDEAVSVSPNSGRVIIQSDDLSKSSGTKVTFTIPAKWKVSHVDAFPPQLTALIEKTESASADATTASGAATGSGTATATVKVGLSELPARGIEQACLTLHAMDGDEAEMVTVPIVLVWR